MLLDMSFLYPGLSMRLAPSFDTGGVLDFALDERREAINRQQRLQEVGAGKLFTNYNLELVDDAWRVFIQQCQE